MSTTSAYIFVAETRGNIHPCPDPAGEKPCLFPFKSKSTLDWDASQSPLSLIKLDTVKAELDLYSHTTLKNVCWCGRYEDWWALWCTIVVPERFHTSVKPKGSQWAVAGTRRESNWACFCCSGVGTAGLLQSRALAGPPSDQHVDVRRSPVYRFHP